METLKLILMRRDGLSEEDAKAQIDECREDLYNRLEAGDMPFDIMGEHFGLEPDYLEDLIH
jgi:hypothetical protein